MPGGSALTCPERSIRRRPRWVAAFLVALEETGGDVTKAVRLVGRSRSTIYEYRERSQHFHALWDAIVDHAEAREVELIPRRRAS